MLTGPWMMHGVNRADAAGVHLRGHAVDRPGAERLGAGVGGVACLVLIALAYRIRSSLAVQERLAAISRDGAGKEI